MVRPTDRDLLSSLDGDFCVRLEQELGNGPVSLWSYPVVVHCVER